MDVDQSSVISMQQLPQNTQTKKKSWTKDIDQISIIKVAEVSINAENGKLSDKTQDNDNSSQGNGYWNLLHVITILIASSISLIPQTMIPRYNEIYYPEYRHQKFITLIPGTFIICSRNLLECVVFTKEKKIKNIKVLLKMFTFFMIPWFICLPLVNYIWTTIQGFQHPMPFESIFCAFVVFLSNFCMLWLGRHCFAIMDNSKYNSIAQCNCY